jgi:hypothetical protein
MEATPGWGSEDLQWVAHFDTDDTRLVPHWKNTGARLTPAEVDQLGACEDGLLCGCGGCGACEGGPCSAVTVSFDYGARCEKCE